MYVSRDILPRYSALLEAFPVALPEPYAGHIAYLNPEAPDIPEHPLNFIKHPQDSYNVLNAIARLIYNVKGAYKTYYQNIEDQFLKSTMTASPEDSDPLPVLFTFCVNLLQKFTEVHPDFRISAVIHKNQTCFFLQPLLHDAYSVYLKIHGIPRETMIQFNTDELSSVQWMIQSTQEIKSLQEIKAALPRKVRAKR